MRKRLSLVFCRILSESSGGSLLPSAHHSCYSSSDPEWSPAEGAPVLAQGLPGEPLAAVMKKLIKRLATFQPRSMAVEAGDTSLNQDNLSLNGS